MLRITVALTITLVVWTVRDVARACSPYHGISPPQTLPASGAVDVPLDAIVRLIYPAVNLSQFQPPVSQDELGDIVVRPIGGESIAGDVEVSGTAATASVTFRPLADLAPNTTYEVLDRVDGSAWNKPFGEPRVRVVFTTGSAVLGEPPSASPGTISVTYTCCSHMCCNDTSFELAWPGESEHFYQVTRSAGPSVLAPYPSARGVIAGGAWYENPDLLGDGTFEVRSVNVAGLVSPPSSVFVEDPCLPTDTTEAADIVEPAPDSAEPSESTPAPNVDGCTSGTSSLVVALILAVAMIVRRRVGLAVAFVGLSATRTTARECSPEWGVGAPTLSPRDGAVGVPRNAPIMLIYPAFNLTHPESSVGVGDLLDVIIRPRGGAPLVGVTVPMSSGAAVTVYFGTGDDLLPMTTYEVLDRVILEPNALPRLGEYKVRSRFTTGTTIYRNGNQVPPGPIAVSYECCDNACCQGTAFTLEWPEIPGATYDVRRLGNAGTKTVGNRATGVIANSALYTYPDLLGDGTFEVTAYDVSGLNSAPSASVFIQDPCSAADDVEPAFAPMSHASAPTWSIGLPMFLPRDGASDVPLNTQIEVAYPTHGLSWARPPIQPSDFDGLVVRARGGAAIEGKILRFDGASTMGVIFRPSAALAPDTVYEILDHISAPAGTWDEGKGVSELAVRATFKTGSVSLQQGPTEAPGPLEVSYRCCEEHYSYCETTFTIAWRRAPDTFYLVNRLAGPQALNMSARFAGTVGDRGDDGDDFSGDGTYEVRAFDLAGLGPSAPATVFVEDPCPNLEPAEVTEPTTEADEPTAEAAEPTIEATEPEPETTEPTPDVAEPDSDAPAPEPGGCASGPSSLVAALILAVAMTVDRRIRLVAVTLIAVGAGSSLHTARPCSPDWYISPPITAPRDGATDVPRNTPIIVVFGAANLGYFDPPITNDDFRELVVRPVGGASIAGQVEVFAGPATVGVRLFPDSPLAANTTYEVLDRVRASGGSSASIGDLAVRLTFTTGTTTADPTGPPPTLDPITVSYECCNSLCCAGTAYTLTMPDAPDTIYSARRVAGGLVWLYGNVAHGLVTDVLGYATPDLLGDGTFEISALSVADLAWNTTTVLVRDTCNAPDVETAEPDIAEPSAEATEVTPVVEPVAGNDDGCTSGSVELLAALILAVQTIRRRSSSSPHSRNTR